MAIILTVSVPDFTHTVYMQAPCACAPVSAKKTAVE